MWAQSYWASIVWPRLIAKTGLVITLYHFLLFFCHFYLSFKKKHDQSIWIYIYCICTCIINSFFFNPLVVFIVWDDTHCSQCISTSKLRYYTFTQYCVFLCIDNVTIEVDLYYLGWSYGVIAQASFQLCCGLIDYCLVTNIITKLHNLNYKHQM